MLIEMIILPLYEFGIDFIATLPVIEIIEVPASVLMFLINSIAVCGYFLPIADMLAMFGIWIAYTIFRMSFNFLKTLREFIPFI